MEEDIKVTFDTPQEINANTDSNAVYYGQLEIGTTTTGEAGSEAIVTNSGSSERAILNFTIPRGEKGIKGDKGDKGETGAKGDTGPQGAKGDRGATGATGSQGPQGPAGATGPRGEKGDKGDKGDTGATGAAGADGKDGSDYVLTTADKQEIANIVLASIPSAEEVSY